MPTAPSQVDETLTGPTGAERPRVLLVADSLYWAAAAIGREIAAHNPGYRFEIQSEPVLAAMLKRSGDYPEYFDVVHFLLPHAASRLGHHFQRRTAVVTTLHHIEGDSCTDALEPSDAVMVGATQWKSEVLALGLLEEQVVHVPYGVDVGVFRPAADGERRRVRGELGLPADAFVLGYCAKRSERKGVDVLLEALRRLAPKLPGLACLFMGPGWEGVVREQVAAGLPCVHFPFTVDARRLARAYRALDVLWVTSRIEGAPLPVLEAMATGVPCVSTPVGIPLDVIVNGENGFLVPFDDPEALCRHTLRLAADPSLRAALSAGARRTVEESCQWSQTTPRASELYERALRRFHAAGRMHRPAGERPRATRELPEAWRRWIEGREHYLYSKFLLNRREYGSAEELAVRAVRTNPRDLRLWLHALVTKLELALRAVRANPRDLKLWLHLQRRKLRKLTP